MHARMASLSMNGVLRFTSKICFPFAAAFTAWMVFLWTHQEVQIRYQWDPTGSKWDLIRSERE
jgi:hypothetical protein